jgi:hypothetical protein
MSDKRPKDVAGTAGGIYGGTRTPISTPGDKGRTVAPAWQQPVPFEERSVPDFPADVLTPWVREWVLGESEATQTPVDLPGMLSFSVLSTACAGKFRVKVRRGFEEGLNTFIVVTLPVAHRKSAVLRDATDPVREFERSERKRQRDSIDQLAQRRRVLEARLERAEREAAKANDESGRAAAMADADSVRRELAEVHVPAEPRFIVDDCTPEKLTMMLDEQGGRIAQLSPEGDVFEMIAGRYQGAPNFDVYLKGHAGDPLCVDRAGRENDDVPTPALTVGLTVQPEVIRGLMARQDFRGRGLVGRFLYSIPRSALGQRRIGPPPVPESVVEAYGERVRALLELPFGTDGAAHILCFDSGADRALADFESELEPRLGAHGDLGWMADWAGKLPGQLARVSALFHMADAAGLKEPWKVPVDADCVTRAVRVGRYLISHAQAAYGAMGADADVAGADHLLGWIKRTQPKRFTKRDAHQENRGRFRRAEELDTPLLLLEEHGCIRSMPAEQQENRPGRKPSPEFEVNPLVGAHIAHNPQNSPSVADSEHSEHSERGSESANRSNPVHERVSGGQL